MNLLSTYKDKKKGNFNKADQIKKRKRKAIIIYIKNYGNYANNLWFIIKSYFSLTFFFIISPNKVLIIKI